MSKPKPNTMDDFNPNDARTWDDKQRAVYEVGHREGESCEGASWTFMLDEAFNIEASDPQEAKALITAKLQEVDRAARESIEYWMPYDAVFDVSTAGRVRRGDRVLKQSTVNGYKRLSVSVNGRKSNILVHRMMAITFLPNPEHKKTVNHKDGNRANNVISNLEWATYSENELHAYSTLGKVNPISKLSPEKLEQARELIAGGQSKAATARQLGVAWSTLHRALTNQTWKRKSKTSISGSTYSMYYKSKASLKGGDV